MWLPEVPSGLVAAASAAAIPNPTRAPAPSAGLHCSARLRAHDELGLLGYSVAGYSVAGLLGCWVARLLGCSVLGN